MIEDKYSVEDILDAMDQIQNKNKINKQNSSNAKQNNLKDSNIPLNTLKLIEEAEKTKS